MPYSKKCIRCFLIAGAPLLVAGASLLAAGCGRVTFDPTAGARSVTLPVDQLPPEVRVQYVPSPGESAFEIHTRAHWVFWILPLNHPDWDEEMRETLGSEAQAMGNLVVRTRTDLWDVLAGLLTLGFYRTTEIIVTGDRIRLVPAPEPGDSGPVAPPARPDEVGPEPGGQATPTDVR